MPFWGSLADYSISGSILGSPYFEKLPYGFGVLEFYRDIVGVLLGFIIVCNRVL